MPALFGAPRNAVSTAALDAWTRSLVDDCSLKVLLELHRAMTSTDFRADLRRITVPTLLIHGDADVSARLELDRAADAGDADWQHADDLRRCGARAGGDPCRTTASRHRRLRWSCLGAAAQWINYRGKAERDSKGRAHEAVVLEVGPPALALVDECRIPQVPTKR